MTTDGVGEAGAGSAAADLIATSGGGRCANCQAPMASDQRYCLSCGARRGRPRFPVASSTEPVAVRSEPRPVRPPRMSPGGTLIAGVATLLIALGVGVLIGERANTSPTRASAPIQVLTVGGGASGPSAANGATPAQSARSSSAKKAAAPKRTKVVVVHLTAKLAQKAASAASKVFGQSGNLSKNVTQQVGQACSGGAGCQNGKFTGNFFGP